MPGQISEQWRRANADLIEFLDGLDANSPASSSFLLSLRTWMNEHGSLTNRQTIAARRHLNLASSEDGARGAAEGVAPSRSPFARAEDLQWMPNGYFTVQVATGEYRYQIYTVGRGSLEGQRIVKSDITGTMRGFGTLRADGSLYVWRRFADSANESWVRYANLLLTVFEESLAPAASNEETPYSISLEHSEVTITSASSDVRVTGTRCCRVCNGAWHADGLCYTHVMAGAPPVAPAFLDEDEEDDEDDIPQPVRGITLSRPGRPRRPRVSANASQVRVGRPTMSQIPPHTWEQ